MELKSIRQVVKFKQSPHAIYEILMDAVKLSHLIRSNAEVKNNIGGKFELSGGDIFGITTYLEDDKKIVQEWYCKMAEWPNDHASHVILEFTSISGGGTMLTLNHTDIPALCVDSISQGWQDYYWFPLNGVVIEK